MFLFWLLTNGNPLAGSREIGKNADFQFGAPTPDVPSGYELKGAARYEYAGYQDEVSTKGVVLDSTQPSGSVGETVAVDPAKGKWITLRIRARAEDGFTVKDNTLFLQMEFLANHGTTPQDKAKRLIYRDLSKDRTNFAVNGDNHKNGAAVWRTYEFEELLPFAQTDSVKLSVGFENGAGLDKSFSRFMITSFKIVQSNAASDGRVAPGEKASVTREKLPISTEGMISLGGRWFYLATPEEKLPIGANGVWSGKLLIKESNSDQLFYKDDHLENPFAGNMTAWLRKGMLDENGQTVTKDRFIPDNVTVEFDGSPYMTLHARDVPNHPIARFPDTYGTQGYNPNYVQEHQDSWRLPLSPQLLPHPTAVDLKNTGMVLPMGPIGVAVNGVVFFNPFDAGMTDATGIMDRCCGHPSPDYRYHYHKYPICVNTPFVDRGDAHSPLLGFAFDGLPIYGPYEAADVMAKDSKVNPLSALNAHYDKDRGWHYHVTPGEFPYLIGGFLAETQIGR